MPLSSFPYTLTNGNTADADEVMSNFNHIKNNFDQDSIEDASASNAEFQATKLPDTSSKPTSGRQELQTLRYQILKLMQLLKPAITTWDEVPAFVDAVLTSPKINDASSTNQYFFGVNELTGSVTITLPLLTGNDIFTFNDFAALLKNKTLEDSSCQFVDNSDNTKKLAFECSGITTGNTRTMTMPNADTTFAFGTYTPTASDTVNTDATPIPNDAMYIRMGSIVYVSGFLTLNPTTTATYTSFQLTLPISSNFSSIVQLAGTGAFRGDTASVVDAFHIRANTTNDKAQIDGYPVEVGTYNMVYTYCYEII